MVFVFGILCNDGYDSTNELVVESRSDLVSQFIGDTTTTTMNRGHVAYGGILMVDQCYQLGKEEMILEGSNRYYKECHRWRSQHRHCIAAMYTIFLIQRWFETSGEK